MSKMVADWSHLPLELLEKIAGTLDEIADRARFGAVCGTWRSASRSPLLPRVRLPWLLLGNKDLACRFILEGNEADGVRSFLSLADDKIYTFNVPGTRKRRCFCSAHGWLIVADESDSNGILLVLLNPITGALFPLPRLPPLHDSIGHCKLIGSPEAFVVMVASSSGRLIYCLRLGGGADVATATWTQVEVPDPTGRSLRTGDFMYHKGHYFVIRERETATLVFDAYNCQAVAVVPAVVEDGLYRRGGFGTVYKRYLAKSSMGDDLFLVISPSRDNENRFEVFKLDQTEQHPEKWTWFKVGNIGCDVVCVDDKNAMVLPASGFDGLRGNCILFCCYDDVQLAGHSWQKEIGHFSLFDIGNDSVEQLTSSQYRKMRGWPNQGWFLPSS